MSQVTWAEPDSSQGSFHPALCSSVFALLCLYLCFPQGLIHRAGGLLELGFHANHSNLSWQSFLGLILRTAQQSIWAGPYRGITVLRLAPEQGEGAVRASQKRGWPSLVVVRSSGNTGDSEPRGSGHIGLSCAQNSFGVYKSLPHLLWSFTSEVLAQLLGLRQLCGSKEALQSLVLPKASLGVRRPSCGLVVWPWIGICPP